MYVAAPARCVVTAPPSPHTHTTPALHPLPWHPFSTRNHRSLTSVSPPVQELESLLEKDIITYESYQSIHSLLPAEASLNGAAPSPQPAAVPVPVAAKTVGASSSSSSPHPPPSYNQTTAAAPPALPIRNGPQPQPHHHHQPPPPPPPPSKPVIAHAKALYAYTASDARDVGFERDDHVLVYEYMNADWWMGRNERTGAEGIFPRTYVEALPGPPQPNPSAYNEKAAYAAPAQPVYGGYPPPPPQQQQQNPYNSAAPPMAVANPQQEDESAGGKAGGMGKKFGKKLGNAAIFGAGASIGSNIVNSIF